MKQLHRWKLYFDKDLEESWLNQLAQQGWGLTSFCLGRYTFEPIEPGEYIYRVDLLPSDEEKKQEYFSLLREMGVEVVHNHGIVHRDVKPQNIIISAAAAQARAPSSCTATRPPKPATTAASPGCFFWLRCWKLSAPSFRYPPSSPEMARSTWPRWYCCFYWAQCSCGRGCGFRESKRNSKSKERSACQMRQALRSLLFEDSF